MPPPIAAAATRAIAAIAPAERRRTGGSPRNEGMSTVGAAAIVEGTEAAEGVDGFAAGAPGAVARSGLTGDWPWSPEPMVRAKASPVATRRPLLGASAAGAGPGGWLRLRVSGWP